MYKRKITLKLAETETCFLWGPRQSGKSTLLKERFAPLLQYDLLIANEVRRLIRNPSILQQEIKAAGVTAANQTQPIIIDEIQKIPVLLDEVHWIIENWKLRFILCGSNARKLKRGHANLLGGRAVKYELFSLVYKEIPDFNLVKALNNGLLPKIYDSPYPQRLLQSYVSDYLKEEIITEALSRNIQAFNQFLDISALSNGEIINYQNIASECGISGPTVKEYFQILEDTLIGWKIPAFRKKQKRRIVQAPKFYYFDVGVAAYLKKQGRVEPGSPEFGKAFEHFICMELQAHASYSEQFYPISYWRTASGFEVDFILGDGEIAIEVKSSTQVNYRQLKSLRAFKEEHAPRRSIVVSMDSAPRMTDDSIEILPWNVFLDALWEGL
jgi:uncharacterized protein